MTGSVERQDGVLTDASVEKQGAVLRSSSVGQQGADERPVVLPLAVREIAALLPGGELPEPRRIGNGYLDRYYLSGAPSMPDGSSPWLDGNPRVGVVWPEPAGILRTLGVAGTYLHHIRHSDSERELHDHPWEWACSVILAGGYREERRVEVAPGVYDIETRVYRAGSMNRLSGNDFHRLELLDPAVGAWTLFVVGPRSSKSWGFWNRETGAWTHWRRYLSVESKQDGLERDG